MEATFRDCGFESEEEYNIHFKRNLEFRKYLYTDNEFNIYCFENNKQYNFKKGQQYFLKYYSNSPYLFVCEYKFSGSAPTYDIGYGTASNHFLSPSETLNYIRECKLNRILNVDK